jgi:hypothetical protein
MRLYILSMLVPCFKCISMISDVSLLAVKVSRREVLASITVYKTSVFFSSVLSASTATIPSVSNTNTPLSTGSRFRGLDCLLISAFQSKFFHAVRLCPLRSPKNFFARNLELPMADLQFIIISHLIGLFKMVG